MLIEYVKPEKFNGVEVVSDYVHVIMTRDEALAAGSWVLSQKTTRVRAEFYADHVVTYEERDDGEIIDVEDENYGDDIRDVIERTVGKNCKHIGEILDIIEDF